MTELAFAPALDRPDLLARPVVAALRLLAWADEVAVAEIDPDLADTAAFSAEYGVPLEQSANCVVLAGRRGGRAPPAAAGVPAPNPAPRKGPVRRRPHARQAALARPGPARAPD